MLRPRPRTAKGARLIRRFKLQNYERERGGGGEEEAYCRCLLAGSPVGFIGNSFIWHAKIKESRLSG